MDTTAMTNDYARSQALSEAVEVLRRRVDKFGVAEPVIQPEGNDRILIQLPGLSEDVKNEARETIKKAAFLELRLVHEKSNELLSQGMTEPGYEVLKIKSTGADGHETITSYLVKKKPELTGKHVTGALHVAQPDEQRAAD